MEYSIKVELDTNITVISIHADNAFEISQAHKDTKYHMFSLICGI
jgi:hypothetical protein